MPKIAGDTNALGKDINNAYKVPTNLSSGTEIDWDVNAIFYNEVDAAAQLYNSKSYTFKNMIEGQTIILIVKNTSSSASLNLSFPTIIKSYLTTVVQPLKENVYTFIRCNGKTYVTVIDGMA